MKQFFLLLGMLLVCVPLVFAAVNVNDYLDNVDEYYYLVLGNESPAGDSSAAIDIALGIQTFGGVSIPTVLEGEVSDNLQMILVGHPCENKLIDLPCDEWPYDEGVGLIKVVDNKLIVSGTTVNDRRRAGKILSDYINYPILYDEYFVLVLGNSLISAELTVEEGLEENDFVCGDEVCDLGERFFCPEDCPEEQRTCEEICTEGNYLRATCRSFAENSNDIVVCTENEVSKGPVFCDEGEWCCCTFKEGSTPVVENETVVQEEPPVQEEKRSFLLLYVLLGVLIVLGVGYILLK